MVRQQRGAATDSYRSHKEKPAMGNQKEIADAISLKKFIDHSCGRIADIALSVESARDIYMQLNPNDTETDFQQWLNSLEEKE